MKTALKFLINSAIVVGVCAIFFIAVKILIIYFSPFLVAVLIALLIDPLVKLLDNKTKLPRWFSSLLSIAIFFISFALIVFVCFSRFMYELKKIINMLPSYYDNINKYINDFIIYMQQVNDRLPPEVLSKVDEGMANVYTSLLGIMNSLKDNIVKVIASLPEILLFLIIIFIASYFFSKDKDKISKFVIRLFPPQKRDYVRKFQTDVLHTLLELIKAHATLILLTTAFDIVGFIILKVDYALTLGIICGILDLLPILGPSLVFIPWIAYSFFMGNTLFAVGLLILFIGMLVFRQVLQAKIISNGLGLHPLLTLISLYVGLKLFGVIGVFLGPLILIIIRGALETGLFPFFRYRGDNT